MRKIIILFNIDVKIKSNKKRQKTSDKNNYYITGASLYKDKLQQALDNM